MFLLFAVLMVAISVIGRVTFMVKFYSDMSLKT